MSNNRRGGILYLAAAVFCAFAAVFNIKNHDIVFVVIAGLAAIVFLIASIASFNAVKEARREAEAKKSAKAKKRAANKKRK